MACGDGEPSSEMRLGIFADGRKKNAAAGAHIEKIVTFVPQRFLEARRAAPTEGIKRESGENPEQFPLLYVPAPLDGANSRDTLCH